MITHVAFEGPDAVGLILDEAQFDLQCIDASVDQIDTDAARTADLLVVMGGPIGVYDLHKYRFLKEELILVEARLATGRHTLGICLGAQLIAHALGARVYPGENGKEIGWAPIFTAHTSSLLGAMTAVPVLHWHGDTFDLPSGAEHLARSARYENQAFRYGTSVLALQFHAEVTPRSLERWWVGHAGEIAKEHIAIPELRADARRHAESANAALRDTLFQWLAVQAPRSTAAPLAT